MTTNPQHDNILCISHPPSNTPMATRKKQTPSANTPTNIPVKKSRRTRLKLQFLYLEVLHQDVSTAQRTIDICRQNNLPVTYATSPSGCLCLRILKTDQELFRMPLLPNGTEDDEVVSAGLPWVEEEYIGRHADEVVLVVKQRRLQSKLHMPYLYVNWKKI